jgi:transcriptional regulator with XRE-family HTH domain
MKLGSFLSESGFSVRDFAKTVNVTEAAMSRYVSGKRLPRTEIMQRIVDASHGEVQPNDFFERDQVSVPVPQNGNHAMTEFTSRPGLLENEAADFLSRRWINSTPQGWVFLARPMRLICWATMSRAQAWAPVMEIPTTSAMPSREP